jgi:hypothetical protein
LFSEEKKVNTGHFNSKADERQLQDVYKVARRKSFVSENIADPVLQ